MEAEIQQFMVEVTPQVAAIAFATGVLLQIAKSLKVLDKVKQWFPFLSIAVAFGISTATGIEDPVLPSLIAGLVASGGYDLITGPMKK